MRKFLLCLAIGLFMANAALAEGDSILRPGHPDRYIVKEGDTLWDIAGMFLSDAWMWPEIWHVNPEIKNPDLIYPGDTIILTYVGGKPQLSVQRGEAGRTTKLSPGQPTYSGDRDVKVEPHVRSSPLSSAIPAIPLDAIAGLLHAGRIVQKDELENAPHILAGKEDRLIFGPGDQFYARGDWKGDSTVYGVYRPGEVYQDPQTHEVLGYEAQEVGTASAERRDDDVIRFQLDSVNEDVRVGDRLLPTEERRVESTFFPSAPDTDVDGVIMTVLGGLTMVGRNDIVALNRGEKQGLKVGNVLAVYRTGNIVRDPIEGDRVRLPAERAGLLMVFRTFEKMSYGLILETKQPLKVGDIVRNP